MYKGPLLVKIAISMLPMKFPALLLKTSDINTANGIFYINA